MKLNQKITNAIKRSEAFFDKCQIKDSWQYLPHLNAEKPTLYSSAFAVMTFHYTGRLETYSIEQKKEWAKYLLSYQSVNDGLFESAEIFEDAGELHNVEHRKLHLTCHILPALNLLGYKPDYRIAYIEQYKNIDNLQRWLKEVDLSKSWIEGNNLLFMGQLFWYEFSEYSDDNAKKALEYLMAWLTKNVDKHTGLWGTDRDCEVHRAMYGSYHQLILYFFQDIRPMFLDKLVDSTLSCQHFDGGFSRWIGGGTCQDIDGIDILVKVFQISSYRRKDIYISLRYALIHILRDRLVDSGGFLDRKGYSFIHNSMPATRTEEGVSNTFSTWFTVHAIADICSILDVNVSYKFNETLSMGWGKECAKNNNFSRSLYISIKIAINNAWTSIVLFLYRVIKSYSR